MLKALKRIVYLVDEVAAARQWYESLLGLEPVFQSPEVAVFRIGDGSLSLARAGGEAGGAGRITAYWEVADVDAAYDRLLECGARPEAAPRNSLTIRTARVTDPFGNSLGITGELRRGEAVPVGSGPSETAHAVAVCRAIAAEEPRAELRRPDPYSILFLKEDVRAALGDASGRQAIIDRRISRPLYATFLARSGFFDEVLVRALDRGLPQVVLLGAGYDTRALRFQDRLGRTRVFELDTPFTQERKLQRLRAAGIPLPDQLAFLAVDFRTESFVDRLREAGYRDDCATLFLCEGVTYYLEPEAVDRTLDLAWAHAGPGSAIAFDYLTRELPSINPAEPFRSWLDPGTLAGHLEARGFRLEDHLDAREMGRRYLALADGSSAELPLSAIRLACAARQPGRAGEKA